MTISLNICMYMYMYIMPRSLVCYCTYIHVSASFSYSSLQPPVIRLYDLHARVNVSVKSGIQLLLMEGGSIPEMFRLEFKSKKEAKAYVHNHTLPWECIVNSVKYLWPILHVQLHME